MSSKQVIIDVREPHEYQSGHLENAINIPPAELMAGAPQIKSHLTLIFFAKVRVHAGDP